MPAFTHCQSQAPAPNDSLHEVPFSSLKGSVASREQKEVSVSEDK